MLCEGPGEGPGDSDVRGGERTGEVLGRVGGILLSEAPLVQLLVELSLVDVDSPEECNRKAGRIMSAAFS